MQPRPKSYTNRLSGLHRDLRTFVVRRGIQAVCGTSRFNLSAEAASDIPLVRAALGMMWLRILEAAGFKSLTASSGLGYKFVCHIGDLAEHPFYHRHAYRKELELCAAWLRQEAKPVMYDVGANDGFFCTQIAQMLGDRSISIYAFEPVPTTFAKLVQSVFRLGLEDRIYPIAAGVMDDRRLVHVRYSRKNSLLAQVATNNLNTRAGDKLAITLGITLDDLYESSGSRPTLLKIDVEGSEVAVLRGARDLISSSMRPAIAFEFSPFTLIECGETPKSLAELITGYRIYYIDDQSGQRMRFGDPVTDFEAIQWTCNLFAVPEVEGLCNRWTSVLEQARRRLRL